MRKPLPFEGQYQIIVFHEFILATIPHRMSYLCLEVFNPHKLGTVILRTGHVEPHNVHVGLPRTPASRLTLRKLPQKTRTESRLCREKMVELIPLGEGKPQYLFGYEVKNIFNIRNSYN